MKIALIGAMDEEVEFLKHAIENREDTGIAGFEFATGRVDGADVVLLKSGIGKVSAAIGTTLLLQLFNPDYVINTGSAGGFHTSLNVGDIVISSEVCYHDVDATVFGYKYGQVPRQPATYTPDEKLVQIAHQAAEQMADHTVVAGLIASGDSFMNDEARVQFIKSKFPELFAGEMEAAAIAQVCHQFNTPFVIIRSLSDIAGKDTRITYDQFLHMAAENSAKLVLDMVRRLHHSE